MEKSHLLKGKRRFRRCISGQAHTRWCGRQIGRSTGEIGALATVGSSTLGSHNPISLARGISGLIQTTWCSTTCDHMRYPWCRWQQIALAWKALNSRLRLSDLATNYRLKPMLKLKTCSSSKSAFATGKAKSRAIGAGPIAGTVTRRPTPGATRKFSI
jgi:hypothetical protein